MRQRQLDMSAKRERTVGFPGVNSSSQVAIIMQRKSPSER